MALHETIAWAIKDELGYKGQSAAYDAEDAALAELIAGYVMTRLNNFEDALRDLSSLSEAIKNATDAVKNHVEYDGT